MIFIMRKINIISRCANAYRSDRLSSDKIHPQHHNFALCISRNPGISQDELADKLYINKSNVTRALSILEEQGLIYRKNDLNDKRILRVFPTNSMNSLLPEIKDASKDWNEYLTEGLSESDIEVFQSVLESITEKAQKYMENRGEDTK